MPLKKRNLKPIRNIQIILFFSLLLQSGLSAQPIMIDGVIAVVGKNVVLKSDLTEQYQQRSLQPEYKGITECQVFEDMLIEKLLLNQADIDSIVVSEDEVEMNIQRRLDYYLQQFGTQQRMEQYYKKSLAEIKEEFTPLVRDQLVSQRMLGEIQQGIEITPSEVRDYYNSLPEDSIPLINSEIEYSEIVKYPEVSEDAVNEAIKRLNDIKERIADGSSFSTMAVLYSEDPGSAKNGGEYKGIKRGQFVKEFEAVAFNLQIGEISNPFKTEYGYHICQLQAKRGQELDLRHILIKPKISAEGLSAAESFLDSIRSLIIAGNMSFEDAALKFSDNDDTKYNGGRAINPMSGDSKWETGQLDKSVFYAQEGLEVGEFSKPGFFRTPDEKEGYRMIKLFSRTEAHVANLQADYQRVQRVALGQKKQDALEDWLDEKIKETYVRVNNESLNCTFTRDWIKKSQYSE